MTGELIDQMNRFVIVVALLLLVFVAGVVVLLAWGAPSGSIDRIADLAGWLRRHNDSETKVALTLIAVVVVLALTSALILEMTPSPTQRMRVRNVKSADAVITTSEIARRVDADVRAAPHIADCASIVAARGKRVEIALDLHVDAGADLAAAADEACRRAQAFVEQGLGIRLASRPRARLHYRELRLRGDPAVSGSVGGSPASPHASTGWERPGAEEERDDRRSTDAPEEAQA